MTFACSNKTNAEYNSIINACEEHKYEKLPCALVLLHINQTCGHWSQI
jgi:hypothetical protein